MNQEIVESSLATFCLDFVLPRGTCACCGRSGVVTMHLSVLDFEERPTCGRCIDRNAEAEEAAIAVYQGDGQWSGACPLVLDAILIRSGDGYAKPSVWATAHDARKSDKTARKRDRSARKKAADAQARHDSLKAIKPTAPAVVPLVDDQTDEDDISSPIQKMRSIWRVIQADKLPAVGAIVLAVATLAGYRL